MGKTGPHQIANSVGGEIFNTWDYEDFLCASHFHRSFELAYVRRGKVAFSVGGREYECGEGEFVLTPPYRSHSFSVPAGALLSVAVFSADLVPGFAEALGEREGENPVFRCEASVEIYAAQTLKKYGKAPGTGGVFQDCDRLSVRSALCAVCAEYLRNVPLTSVDRTADLLSRLLLWVGENFREDVTLKDAAAALGYHYQYLSRCFHRSMGVNFRTLLNQYRYGYARETLLREPRKNLSEVALESGFGSVRTFNRVWLEFTGKTPREDFSPEVDF